MQLTFSWWQSSEILYWITDATSFWYTIWICWRQSGGYVVAVQAQMLVQRGHMWRKEDVGQNYNKTKSSSWLWWNWEWACWTRACFLSLAQSKLRLWSANHRAGYFSNLACDWLSIVWAYSELETENGPRTWPGDLKCLGRLFHLYLPHGSKCCIRFYPLLLPCLPQRIFAQTYPNVSVKPPTYAEFLTVQRF